MYIDIYWANKKSWEYRPAVGALVGLFVGTSVASVKIRQIVKHTSMRLNTKCKSALKQSRSITALQMHAELYAYDGSLSAHINDWPNIQRSIEFTYAHAQY